MGSKGKSTSVEAILEGTRRVIAERGPGKLTLSAIAETAGVSSVESGANLRAFAGLSRRSLTRAAG